MSNAEAWGEPSGPTTAARSPSPSNDRARSRSPDRRERDREDDRGRPQHNGGGGGGGNNPGNNLHVSGLSNRATEADLEDAFSKFGRVQKAQVMRDPHTKEPRGFAFVTMETPEEADAAISALNATEIQGKMISVERARRGRARTPTPGAYHGPPKREIGGRDRYDDRDRYYDRRDDYRRDDRRDDYRRDDYRRDDRYGSYAAPMRGDDRDRRGGGGYYDDRRYDDRRSSRYDDDRRRY